jgi:hypothetical protein
VDALVAERRGTVVHALPRALLAGSPAAAGDLDGILLGHSGADVADDAVAAPTVELGDEDDVAAPTVELGDEDDVDAARADDLDDGLIALAHDLTAALGVLYVHSDTGENLAHAGHVHALLTPALT